MNEKIEYIRYLHQFLLDKSDYRSTEVREWLYHNSNNNEEFLKSYLNRIYHVFSESYSDLLSFKQWIRNSKIDKLLD